MRRTDHETAHSGGLASMVHDRVAVSGRAAAARPLLYAQPATPSATAASVETVRDAADFHALLTDWHALAGAALEPAPTSEPVWAVAAMNNLMTGGPAVEACFVWRHNSEAGVAGNRVLIGVFLHRQNAMLHGLPLRIASRWQHLFCFLGTPLLHRTHADEAIETYLDYLEDQGARAYFLPELPLSGAVADAFNRVVGRSGRADAVLSTYERAAYKIDGPVEAYLTAHLSRKRRKEFRRLRTRLAETGELTFESRASGSPLEDWTSQFYALEKSGWKGRSGTAIANKPEWHRFFDEALRGQDAAGDLLFWRLLLNGEPVAMLFAVRRGKTVWLAKITYDEACARFSPGSLIIFDVMEHLTAEGGVETIDSCALPDHPMINHIWRDGVSFHDRVIAARTTPRWMFNAIVAHETAWRRARALAKRYYINIKNRLKGGSK